MVTKTVEADFELASIGIDIGKDVFHVVGFDIGGRVVLRRKIKRLALVKEFERLPRCVVGMEACLSAHFVSRTLRGLGFEPRIMPAKYTKPFIKGQKNDFNDAEAVAEAALRPNLKLVQPTASFGTQSVACPRNQRCCTASARDPAHVLLVEARGTILGAFSECGRTT